MRRFKRLQFSEQFVVFSIGNLRRIEHVVVVGVRVDLTAQLPGPAGGGV